MAAPRAPRSPAATVSIPSAICHPGNWSVSVQLPGHTKTSAPPLPVQAGAATRADVVLNGAPGAPPVPQPLPSPAAPATPAAPAAAAAPALVAQLPEAPQAPAPAVDTQTPFAFGDVGWMNGTGPDTTPIFDTKLFTPEVRFDVNYLYDFNHPRDHTIVGRSEE